jgi:hypothetical protein
MSIVRVSSATLHVCGVRMRHCNHHRGFSGNTRSAGGYKNMPLCPRLTMSFLHQTIKSLQSPKHPSTKQSSTSSLFSFSIQSPPQTTISSNPNKLKYNGLRNVPTILHPHHQLLRCFHLLQEILHLQHPSSLHTRLPGLHRPLLP